MGRPVILANGTMLVGLNEQGLVHDFYYPYVGLDNLTTARSVQHKIGVWVDGDFAWIDDGRWNIKVDFETDALISSISMDHHDLGISLEFQDFVDFELNAFCRAIKVHNKREQSRDIRIFMHQVFQISRSGRADTALFVPDGNYLLDYKGRCSLLAFARDAKGRPFDQYAIGNYGIEGKEGTFKDAEDGELSGNAVEHGGVDSVLRLQARLDGNASQDFEYWVVAAASQQDTEKVHAKLLSDGLPARLEKNRKHWADWMSVAVPKLSKLDKDHVALAKKSLLIIKAHIDKRGSILASADSSIFNYGRDYYCYCWPRDGSYAIWPLIRLGIYDEAKKFFEFCRDILHEDGYLMHKYQPDRAIGSTWHPLVHNNQRELAIQEDETASVIIMLGEFLEASGQRDFVELLYSTFVRPAANFMAKFIDDPTSLPHASYDLWEEKFLTSTYSVAATYQALLTAADMAEMFEFPDDVVAWKASAARIEAGMDKMFDTERQAYRKGVLMQPDGTCTNDNTLDVSSLYGMMMFGPEGSSEKIRSTAELIEKELMNQSPSGGCPRYEVDWYMRTKQNYKGNPWFVCSLWLAQYYIQTKQIDKARDIVHWTMSRTLPSGVLSEQVDPEDSGPIGVAPLVWSHAEFINTVLDIAG